MKSKTGNESNKKVENSSSSKGTGSSMQICIVSGSYNLSYTITI